MGLYIQDLIRNCADWLSDYTRQVRFLSVDATAVYILRVGQSVKTTYGNFGNRVVCVGFRYMLIRQM